MLSEFGDPSRARKSEGAVAAYARALGACPSCGPTYPLQVRDLERCGFRGPGQGAWCGRCQKVYALDAVALTVADEAA